MVHRLSYPEACGSSQTRDQTFVPCIGRCIFSWDFIHDVCISAFGSFLLPCSIALYRYDKFSFSMLLVNFWGYFAVYINVSINFFYVWLSYCLHICLLVTWCTKEATLFFNIKSPVLSLFVFRHLHEFIMILHLKYSVTIFLNCFYFFHWPSLLPPNLELQFQEHSNNTLKLKHIEWALLETNLILYGP